jgi:hypothetical protein
VAALDDSGEAEGACLSAGGERAPVGGESWAAIEVPATTAVGGGGGTVGAHTR